MFSVSFVKDKEEGLVSNLIVFYCNVQIILFIDCHILWGDTNLLMYFFLQLNLFGDADQDWVRSKVVAYLDHGDVVSAVCNYMLESGFPKVNDKAVIPEPKVCIQPGLGLGSF